MQIEDVKKWIQENTRYQVDSYIWGNVVQDVGESTIDAIGMAYGSNIGVNGKIAIFGFASAIHNHEETDIMDFDGLVRSILITPTQSIVRGLYMKEPTVNKIFFNGYILSLIKQGSRK